MILLKKSDFDIFTRLDIELALKIYTKGSFQQHDL